MKKSVPTRTKIVNYLSRRKTPATAFEISSNVKEPIECVRARLSELSKAGLVESVTLSTTTSKKRGRVAYIAN